MKLIQRTLATLLAAALPFLAHAAKPYRYSFEEARPLADRTRVAPDMVYQPARGFGLEPGTEPGKGKPWFFLVDLPEGNYDVTISFGSDQAAGRTTVKAELRRLMVENLATARGETIKRTFTVNVRTPAIPAAGDIKPGAVRLKSPRESVQEAAAWDRRLTLEFNGDQPAVRAIDIVPVSSPTLFLLGDSTVCDQSAEPYTSWGQMLTRFVKPGVAVANHGESGETYRDSLGRRRIDKIAASLKPGDTVLMQFGHNDQKQVKEGKGGPFTTYKAEIRQHIDMIRARGGTPVLLSPMERRAFDDKGKVLPSLIEYADAARQAAEENKVRFIDLNALSKPFYEALGVEGSAAAFARPAPDRIDNTHHNAYGAYILAKLVAAQLRAGDLPVGRAIVDDLGTVAPAHPDPLPATFQVPASPIVTTQRPLGDEANP